MISNVSIALASPYLTKTGESFAEEIGKDIWTLLKKPFVNTDKETDFSSSPDMDKLKTELIAKVNNDHNYRY